jgi:hypothetical protein
MAKVPRNCVVCGKAFSIKPSALKRGRGRCCSPQCAGSLSAKKYNDTRKVLEAQVVTDLVPTRKLTNQVRESFTLPLKPYNITISKLLNGRMLVFSDTPVSEALPTVAAAYRAVEHTVLEHYVAGVDVMSDAYLKGLALILHRVCKTHEPEIWGYETDA